MSRKATPPTDAELIHWKALIRTFVPLQFHERWLKLVHTKYRRWGDLPISDFVDYQTDSNVAHIQAVRSVESLHETAAPRITPLHECLILVTRPWKGEETGSITCSYRDLSAAANSILEGVVSIVPGEIAIVVDHEGNTLHCMTRKARKCG